MSAKKSGSVAERVEALAKPVAESLGLILWDVVYEKEGAFYYLRVYIDKSDGPVGIEDCENMTRPLSEALDKQDPIEGSYTLEVGSPGIDRRLRKKEHFEACLNKPVKARLIREKDGIKEIAGILLKAEKDYIIISAKDGDVKILLSETAYVRLNNFMEI